MLSRNIFRHEVKNVCRTSIKRNLRTITCVRRAKESFVKSLNPVNEWKTTTIRTLQPKIPDFTLIKPDRKITGELSRTRFIGARPKYGREFKV